MDYTVVPGSLMHKNISMPKRYATQTFLGNISDSQRPPASALQSPFAQSGSDHVILKIEGMISD